MHLIFFKCLDGAGLGGGPWIPRFWKPPVWGPVPRAQNSHFHNKTVVLGDVCAEDPGCHEDAVGHGPVRQWALSRGTASHASLLHIFSEITNRASHRQRRQVPISSLYPHLKLASQLWCTATLLHWTLASDHSLKASRV